MDIGAIFAGGPPGSGAGGPNMGAGGPAGGPSMGAGGPGGAGAPFDVNAAINNLLGGAGGSVHFLCSVMNLIDRFVNHSTSI